MTSLQAPICGPARSPACGRCVPRGRGRRCRGRSPGCRRTRPSRRRWRARRSRAAAAASARRRRRTRCRSGGSAPASAAPPRRWLRRRRRRRDRSPAGTGAARRRGRLARAPKPRVSRGPRRAAAASQRRPRADRRSPRRARARSDDQSASIHVRRVSNKAASPLSASICAARARKVASSLRRIARRAASAAACNAARARLRLARGDPVRGDAGRRHGRAPRGRRRWRRAHATRSAPGCRPASLRAPGRARTRNRAAPARPRARATDRSGRARAYRAPARRARSRSRRRRSRRCAPARSPAPRAGAGAARSGGGCSAAAAGRRRAMRAPVAIEVLDRLERDTADCRRCAGRSSGASCGRVVVDPRPSESTSSCIAGFVERAEDDELDPMRFLERGRQAPRPPHRLRRGAARSPSAARPRPSASTQALQHLEARAVGEMQVVDDDRGEAVGVRVARAARRARRAG